MFIAEESQFPDNYLTDPSDCRTPFVLQYKIVGLYQKNVLEHSDKV